MKKAKGEKGRERYAKDAERNERERKKERRRRRDASEMRKAMAGCPDE